MAKLPQLNEKMLWFFLAAITLGLLFIGHLRDERAFVHAFDTGIYLQLAHNFFAYGSLDSSLTGEANFLAHHFQPIILLFSPIIATFLRSTTLFALSALAVVLSIVIVASFCPKERSRTTAILVFLGVIVHPAVSGRMFYGFVPEILAFPALTWMALQLVGEPRHQKPWPWLLAFFWILLCKETLFLTASAVAWTMTLRSQRKTLWYSCAAACIAGFLLLFFWWMPHHSLLPSYYGLNYYFPESGKGLGGGRSLLQIFTQLASNLFSLATVKTIFSLAWMTAFLPFLGLNSALIPALPGLLIIICSAEDAVHSPANHYLIPMLPFLAASSLENISRLEDKATRLIRFAIASSVVLLPFSYTLLHEGGVLSNLSAVNDRPKTAFYEEDLAKIANLIPRGDSLLVSSHLQPHLARYRNIRIMHSFTGNPIIVDDAYLRSLHWVVAADDLKKITDCWAVTAGGINMDPGLLSFVKICERVKNDGEIVVKFPDSGLTVYKILANERP